MKLTIDGADHYEDIEFTHNNDNDDPGMLHMHVKGTDTLITTKELLLVLNTFHPELIK